MAAYQKTFTLGDGTQIVVPLSSLSGIVEVSQQRKDGKALPAVRFSFDLSKTHTYEQDVQGTLIGSPTFSIGGFGWKREENQYYWGEALESNPLKYNLPGVDGRPSYKICVGSDYYSQFYATKGISSYMPGGIHNADAAYLIPSSFDVSKGGNDPSCFARGIDGRSYCAILNNYYGGGQAPMLFYQDAGSLEWCQYFFPFDLSAGTITGAGSIWSGSFVILKQDMTISGRAFKRGQVLYVYGIPGNGSWQPTVFGVKAPQTQCEVHFWAVADSIDQMPMVGGVLRFDPGNGSGGDPRLFFEGGKLCYGTNAQTTTPKGYEVYRVDSLVESGVAQITRIAAWDAPKPAQTPPAGAFQNSECGAPVKMNGFNLMGFSTQIVNAGGVWNTLKNNNKIVKCGADWAADMSTVSTIDIGYDSYAIALSAENPEDPNCKTGFYGSTLMNWGSRNMQLYGTKPGLPWLPFSVNDNGCLKFGLDNFTDAGFTSLPVYINSDTGSLTSIIDKGGLIVDYANTATDYFAWKLTQPVAAPDVLNDPAAYGAIQKIYYRQNGALLTVLIRTDDSHHDILATFWNTKGQQMKPAATSTALTGEKLKAELLGSSFYAPLFVDKAANLCNTDWQQNGLKPLDYSGGWAGNDNFGYTEDADGNAYSCELFNRSGNNPFGSQTITVFKRDAGSEYWYPIAQPFVGYRQPVYNGSLYWFKQDTALSGRTFKAGEVLWSIPYNGTVYFYVSKGISTPYFEMKLQGKLGDGSGSDVRMVFEGGQIKCAYMSVAASTPNAYGAAVITDFNSGAATNYNLNFINTTQTVAGGTFRYELPNPLLIQGVKLLMSGIQLKNSSGAQVFENDFISSVGADWKPTGEPRQLNIGYDSYASYMSAKDLLNPSSRGIHLIAAWAWQNSNTFIASAATGLEFNMTDGFIDYDVSGFANILRKRYIVATVNGSQAFKIDLNNPGILTVPNSYGAMMIAHDNIAYTYNPVPATFGNISVYWQQRGRMILVVMKMPDNHDVVGSFMMKKYSPSAAVAVFSSDA